MMSLSKAIKDVGNAYHVGAASSQAAKVEAGMQKVLSNPRFWRSGVLGDPIQWLPDKKRKLIEEAVEDTWKKYVKDPQKLSSAKDEVGISDLQARTLMRRMVPPLWVPSAKKLVAARKNSNEEIQVSPPTDYKHHVRQGNCDS
jgi:hypothetical protein